MSGGMFGTSGQGAESSNRTDNPLRSYRMSMLAHGFVDQPDDAEFTLDESDPMTYSVVRTRGGSMSGLRLAGTILFVVVVVVVVIIFG